MNLYNEIDKDAAQWLRNLIDARELPPGYVDEKSITELSPSELQNYTQAPPLTAMFIRAVMEWIEAKEVEE